MHEQISNPPNKHAASLLANIASFLYEIEKSSRHARAAEIYATATGSRRGIQGTAHI